MENLVINIVIGLVVFIGFFVYWGRISGWYKKGGIVYEFFHKKNDKKKK